MKKCIQTKKKVTDDGGARLEISCLLDTCHIQPEHMDYRSFRAHDYNFKH